MKRIAVCISGLIRFWEETYPLYQHWNNLFDDVEFVFYIATWKRDDTWYDKTRTAEGIIKDIDFTKYKFVNYWTKLDDTKVYHRRGIPSSLPYMAYAIKHVHKLRNESGEKFDGVITTRNDVVVPYKTIKDCVEMVRNKPYHFTDNAFFNIPALKSSSEQSRLILQKDYFHFGTEKSMDKFSEMYDSYESNELIEKSNHYAPAEHLFNKNLMVIKMGAMPKLIKEKSNPFQKKGWPTPSILRKIYQEEGIEYMFGDWNTIDKRFYTEWDNTE